MNAKHKYLATMIERGGYHAIVASLLLSADYTKKTEMLKRYTRQELRKLPA
ncbi:hypothetical protein EMIT07CA2_550134 [Brevibacillus sp. IT-7CA2]|uniref:hypothetical protein n=1 Tax=Brevibacillus sp. IT-7CA2 TaxID=3026436 RepID=UPI0039DFA8A3